MSFEPSPLPTQAETDARDIAMLHELADITMDLSRALGRLALEKAAEGDAKAAGDLGRKMSGYPEYYLNINKASTVSIIESMIRKQCAAKGFDGVEPDIDDSYTDSTGYKITEVQNEKYDKKLGAYAHSLGLAWGQKNGDNDRAFSSALQPSTDFLLTEECNFYQSCGIVTRPYVRARKLVLDAEYTDDWGANVAKDLGKFCAADASGSIDGTLFSSSLAGPRNPCR